MMASSTRANTRKALGFLLATVWEARHREVRTNSFGIARM